MCAGRLVEFYFDTGTIIADGYKAILADVDPYVADAAVALITLTDYLVSCVDQDFVDDLE
jgi:hypothetical protein